MSIVINSLEVVAGATHEGVMKLAEVGAVLNSLGENVGDIAFATDMKTEIVPLAIHS